MNRGRSRNILASVAAALWMICSTNVSIAAEETKAPEPAKAEAPAAAPVAAAPAPKLPAYFTATSDDPKKPPPWPDPTGGASGVWATPAGDAKGDVPDTLKLGDVYDRMVHNLYSINYMWVLIAGFLVMFMQAGFMFVETGLCRAKNASHTSAMNFMVYPLGCLAFWVYGFAIGWGNWWNGPVPPGWYPSLGPGLSVLSEGWGLGAAVDAAGKATGAFTYGIIGTERLVLDRRGERCVGDSAVFLHDGFHGYDRDDTDRRHGRTLGMEELLYLRLCGSHCRTVSTPTGFGAVAGLRRAVLTGVLGHGAVDFAGSGVVHAMGGIIASCRRYGHRSAYWQIRSARPAQGSAGSQCADGGLRDLYSGFRLVWFQSRFDSCRAPIYELA